MRLEIQQNIQHLVTIYRIKHSAQHNVTSMHRLLTSKVVLHPSVAVHQEIVVGFVITRAVVVVYCLLWTVIVDEEVVTAGSVLRIIQQTVCAYCISLHCMTSEGLPSLTVVRNGWRSHELNGPWLLHSVTNNPQHWHCLLSGLAAG